MSRLDEDINTKIFLFIISISQMEKAVSHYNGKKQLLQESQEEVAELKHSLEVKEGEVKAITMENKIIQLDLDKAQASEKKLINTVASLEAQVGFMFLSILFNYPFRNRF